MRIRINILIVSFLGITAVIALFDCLRQIGLQQQQLNAVIAEQQAQIAEQNQRLLALEAEQSKRLSWKGKIKTGLALTWQATKEYILRQHIPTI